MKRNMLAAAIFVAAGIYIWNNFNIYSVSAVVIALLCYCVWCFIKGRKGAAVAAIVFVCLGFLIINTSNEICLSKTEPFNGETIRISGKVCDVSETSYGQQFVVKHKYKDEKGKERYIKIKAYSSDIKFQFGDKIEFDAKTKVMDTGGGFGDYNEQMNERSKGILLETTGGIKNVEILGNFIDKKNIFDVCYVLKTKLCERAENLFDENTAPLVQGILAGEKENISPEVNEDFRKSGLAHILVVSGMHVNIILTVLMFILTGLGIGKSRKAVVIYIVAIWFFTIMTGAGFSAVRSATVVSLLFFGNLVQRDADPLNSLGVAVLVMLLYNPSVYFNTGFRLSVFATGGILLFSGGIKEKMKFLPHVLREAFAVTFSAQLGAFPFITQSFGTIGILGTVANMIVSPVIVIIVAITILAIALGNVPFIGAILIKIAETAFGAVLSVAKFFADIPYMQLETRSFEGMVFVIYGMFLCSFKLWLSKNSKVAVNMLLCGLICLCAVAGYNVFADNTSITFLHTGNSDCTILQNNNMTILFDGSGDRNYNVAESKVMPYLRRRGIKDVDIAFVTHYHTDHALGIAELIEMGRVKRVVVPVGIYKSDSEIFKAAEKADIPLHYIGSFDKINLGDIEVEAVNVFDGKEQNNGMVYFVTYGENRICITGDIHKDGEMRLIESGVNLKCNILKVPHHGSDTSGSEEFLKSTGADYAVILRGDNEYPDEKQKELYRKCGIKLYSSNDCGSIRIKLSKNGNTQFLLGKGSFYELRNIKKTS